MIEPRPMDASALANAIAAGTAPRILDVRSVTEYRNGHIPGALNMPFWLLPFRASTLPLQPDQPLVVYCGHGPRAHIARVSLERRGYRHVTLLTGHMQAWRDAGLPEVKE